MAKTITAGVGGTSDTNLRAALTKLQGIGDMLLSTGGLAIKAGGSAIVKAATLCKAIAGETLVSIAANTDMAALVGTVTNAKFNVYAFFVDAAGAVTTSMGTEGATLAAVIFPSVPANKACIGFIIVNPTGTGNFVGGTTALDDATVVPNVVYVNTPYPFRGINLASL